MNDNSPLSADILRGAASIADYLGFERRAVYHAVSKGSLPHFHIGETVCARKSTITAWIQEQESASRSAA